MNLSKYLRKASWAVAALCIVSFSAEGSDKENRTESGKILRGPYETNNFFDNTFVSIGGGLNFYEGSSPVKSLGQCISPALDIYVGKWFTPAIGIRAGYSGLTGRTWAYSQNVFSPVVSDNGFYRTKFAYSYVNAAIMFNASDIFSGYRKDRLWNFVPYISTGLVHSNANGGANNEFGIGLGLLNNIRLSDLIDLTLEARQVFFKNDISGKHGGVAGMFTASVGVAFNFGKKHFDRAVRPDYTSYNERISSLEADNTFLKNENKKLTREVADLKNRKPEVKIVKEYIEQDIKPSAVYFTIGSAVLTPIELAHLDAYVKNVMSYNPEKKFTLTGYADKQTGSARRNNQLSEMRVKYVYDLLVNKYGINPENLTVKHVGSTENRYNSAEQNRCVVIE